MPDAISLERGKKCTVVEPVHSAVPAATASHGAATASHGASANAIPARWKERMQRFQEERCSTHAFLQMNGKQVQLQKAGWSKELSLAHLF